jgi:exodeoxyribonuclease VIII
MHDVMIDLETMSTRPNAAIVAIGAVEFDIKSLSTGRAFYRVVDLDSSIRSGGEVDADTILWWLRQSEPARLALLQDTEHISTVLVAFSTWIRESGLESDAIRVWGNGSDFDNVILASAYRRWNITLPWKFFNNRCFRTFKSIHHDIKTERVGTAHNALDDAMHQARHLLAIESANLRAIEAGKP